MKCKYHGDTQMTDDNKPKYEMFLDECYFHMWCVRNTDDRRFDSPTSFHFVKKSDAEEFKRLIEIAR